MEETCLCKFARKLFIKLKASVLMQINISPGKKIGEVAFGKEKLILRAIRLKDAEGCMKFFNKIIKERARVLLVEKVNLETEKNG